MKENIFYRIMEKVFNTFKIKKKKRDIISFSLLVSNYLLLFLFLSIEGYATSWVRPIGTGTSSSNCTCSAYDDTTIWSAVNNRVINGTISGSADGNFNTTSIQVTGTTTKTLNLKQDGQSNLTASWTDYDTSGYNSLSDLQGAVSNDFHNLGGTDADSFSTSDNETIWTAISNRQINGTDTGGGSQTPWLDDEDADGHSLNNVKSISSGSIDAFLNWYDEWENTLIFPTSIKFQDWVFFTEQTEANPESYSVGRITQEGFKFLYVDTGTFAQRQECSMGVHGFACDFNGSLMEFSDTNGGIINNSQVCTVDNDCYSGLYSTPDDNTTQATAIANLITSNTTQATALSVITSGVYTPTLYNVTNIAASTAYEGMYSRVGNTVVFSGTIAIDVTSAGAFAIGITVPINSAFNDVGQASGVGNNLNSEVARVFADVVNANRIKLQGTTAVTTNYAWSYMLIYQIK